MIKWFIARWKYKVCWFKHAFTEWRAPFDLYKKKDNGLIYQGRYKDRYCLDCKIYEKKIIEN